MASPSEVSLERVYFPERRRTNEPRDDILELDEMFASAYVVAQRGELTRAYFLADQLIRRDPDYPGVWAFKAWVCMKLGLDREAEECRKRARNERF